MKTKNIPAGYGLRVGIRGGAGCGGHQFILGFDKPRETDLTYTLEGITVHVDKKHMMYVFGKEVDYHQGDDGVGFVFNDATPVAAP